MPTQNYTGFLAYFDLLGFSNKITENDFEEFERYYKVIDRAVGRYSNINYKIFSDSVIVYTESLEDHKFKGLIEALSQIYYQLVVKLSIPLCGAVSCGDFSIHEISDNLMISGSPIVDAVNLEGNQNWIGIILSPKVIERNDNIKELINHQLIYKDLKNIEEKELKWGYSHLYVYDKIPLKNDTIIGLCIVPHDDSNRIIDIIHDIDLLRKRLVIMKLSGITSHVQNKFTNTDKMLEKIQKDYSSLSE